MLDAFGCRETFRHGAPQFLDRLTHLGANFAMGLVGVGLADDLFPAEFFFGLGCAEQVGRKLGATHVIQYVLTFLQALTRMDILRTESSVEAQVAVILENCVVARLDDPGPFAASAS